MFRYFFGGEQEEQAEGTAASTPVTPSSKQLTMKAVKWLGTRPQETKSGAKKTEESMFVNEEAANKVLGPVGEMPVNLISIFGAARQGKSFLMNLLADQEDLFKISNQREPCTQGVDLSSTFVPLSDFSALNNCPRVSGNNKMQIGFVDAEGQGDRDISYDSRLVSPVLLSSKVVLFNWKDSLQADRMLNLLGVLSRAAQGIDTGENDSTSVFGHLHIVFRDWSFVNSSPEDVYNDLFQKEKGRSEEVHLRNLARDNLKKAFTSITIWLFPAPVANTAHLKDKIRFEQLQVAFQSKLKQLRKQISMQLKEPMVFNKKQLTGRMLSKLVPALVETLNSDDVIMPASIYSSMVRSEAQAAKEKCAKDIAEVCDATVAEDIMSNVELEKTLHHEIDRLIQDTLKKLQSLPKSLLGEIQTSLRQVETKEIDNAKAKNDNKITQRLSKEVNRIMTTVSEQYTAFETKLIPTDPSKLQTKCQEVLNKQLKMLDKLPVASNGHQVLQDEKRRIRDNASILQQKLEVMNDRKLEASNKELASKVQQAKTQLAKDAHDRLEKKLQQKQAFTLETVRTMVHELCQRQIRQLQSSLTQTHVDVAKEMDPCKEEVEAEVVRRYHMEVQQLVHNFAFEARDEMQSQVHEKVEKKLPTDDRTIDAQVSSIVQGAKIRLSDQVRGWSIMRDTLTSKSQELDRLSDTLSRQMKSRNADLQRDSKKKQEQEAYESTRKTLVRDFKDEVKKIGLPVDEQKIDACFQKLLKQKVDGLQPSSRVEVQKRLVEDCQDVLENQKTLNTFALEKQKAKEEVEQERKRREEEKVAAKEKEAEVERLRQYVEKSMNDRESESKQLQRQLQEESDRAKRLREEVEKMKTEATVMQEEKKKVESEARAKEERSEAERRQQEMKLKHQLEEMKLRASEMEIAKKELEIQMRTEGVNRQEMSKMKHALDDMKVKAGDLERQKRELEMRADDESSRREEAESAARAAADAAALSAKAAMEAAASDEDVEMEPPTSRKGKARAKPVKKASKKEASSKGGSALEEARRAAQEEMQKRIAERTKNVPSTRSRRKRK